MPRSPFLIVDQHGQRLGILKALRDHWRPGEQLIVRGGRYRVTAVVPLEQPDSSGATAMLIVSREPDTPARTAES
jgi:hypothetical protein